MKKIVLINPAYKTSLHSNIRTLALPPLNLAVIASYTPEHYEITIVDESVEDLDFDMAADLVGITCMTPLAPRAYEISKRFRDRNIPVVMGGVHVSAMSEEAQQYADAIVIGEGEMIWPQVLEDFEAGQLKKTYRVSDRPDITHQRIPRRDLFKGDYFVETVQTSRGCPFDCNFCSVTAFNGAKIRMRDVDEVVQEITDIDNKRIFIVDDNIIGAGQKCIRRSFELFERLKGCGKEWAGQTCLNIVEHDGLLKSASDAGAKVFLIGFESLDKATISSMNKSVNLRPNTKNFKDAIRKIHDNGIAIVGCFIFGADTHDKEVFEKTVEFVWDAQIDAVQFTVNTPLPGTKLYRSITEESRLLYSDYPNDWKHYTILEPVFQPKQMQPEELYEGLISSYKEVSSFGRSLARGARTLMNTKSLFSAGISFSWNYDAYKTIRHSENPYSRNLK
ncbi:MAG: radical SAM protein [Pseudomonadota bacterium]